MIYLEIKILNSQTIKITLTTKDMKKYNITHEILKNNEKITKELVLKLLNKIKEIITINISKNKMFLESFKTKEKGCILYLSVPSANEKTILNLPKKDEPKTTIAISKFKTLKNIKQFCKNINALKNEKFKSELYNFENNLILVTFIPKNEKKEILALTKEFGQIYGEGEIKYSIIKEHCKLIFEKDAIEKIIEKNLRI